MGEIAEIAMVSKRTIDYYTSIGLLRAERSKSNYRIYSDESISDLKFIEECKSLHYPLDEIRRKLEIRKTKKLRDSEVEKHVKAVTQQMKQLQNELCVLQLLLEKLDQQQKEEFSTTFNIQGNALMKSLLNLTS
ncbi:MerR family transcriptional regulator [Neobacillus ginsengisoli]|nr:MerR family transcriptional regulator [Neobacillus ginsengisoli]